MPPPVLARHPDVSLIRVEKDKKSVFFKKWIKM